MTSPQQQSGYFPTSTRTPTGEQKRIAVNNPYIHKDEYINTVYASGLELDASSAIYSSGELERIILAATSWVNRITKRYFDTQTIDETKGGYKARPTSPDLFSVTLANRPYQSIDSIYIQVFRNFIELDISSNDAIIQDFNDYGYYKIVPLMTAVGQSSNFPVPGSVLGGVEGVIWTRYTFGFGMPVTKEELSVIAETDNKKYQASSNTRLWAPDQETKVFADGTEVNSADYTIDYPNGIVTFATSPTAPVTASFMTNMTIPQDIKEACMIKVSDIVGQATRNPLGVTSKSIQTFSVSFGDKQLEQRAMELISPYIDKRPAFF